MKWKTSLTKKLLVSLLAVGLLPMAVISFIASRDASRELEENAYAQLRSAREIKKDRIESYFNETRDDLKVLTDNIKATHAGAWENLEGVHETKSDQVLDLLREMRMQLDTLSRSHAVRTAFADFKAYHDATGATALGPLEISTEAYREVYDRWYEEFAVYAEKYGYYDIFFICAAHGHVLFTQAKESDLGTNLRAGPYKKEGLAELWRSVVETGQISVADYESYAPSGGDYAAFMGAPVFDRSGEVVAVVEIGRAHV